MRVKMLKGQVVPLGDAGWLEYTAGLVYEVDDTLAQDWIKRETAVDETGQISRWDLLTPEERANELKDKQNVDIYEASYETLRDIAKELGVSGYSSMTKKQLISAILGEGGDS